MKVVFKAPTLGYHGSILISPKALAQPAAQQTDLSKIPSSGSYVVVSWKEGDFVKLVKRKDYKGSPNAGCASTSGSWSITAMIARAARRVRMPCSPSPTARLRSLPPTIWLRYAISPGAGLAAPAAFWIPANQTRSNPPLAIAEGNTPDGNPGDVRTHLRHRLRSRRSVMGRPADCPPCVRRRPAEARQVWRGRGHVA